MKKIIALLLALVMVLSLCGCGTSKGPKGTYEDSIGFSKLTFSGSKVIFDPINDDPKTGKYKMDGDTVSIEYPDGGQDSYVYNEENDTLDFMGLGVLFFTKAE